MRKLIAIFFAIGASSAAQAIPGVPVELVNKIEPVISQCSGSWQTNEKGAWKQLTALDLISSLRLATKNSASLTFNQGRDIYRIGKGLIAPSLNISKNQLSDGNSSIICASHPEEAVALFQYLAGKHPADLRGPTNVHDWLALAYSQGVGVRLDSESARIWWLKSRIGSSFSRNKLWSDGINDDVADNIRRAGLWKYLEEGSQLKRGIEARRILADELLIQNPVRARELLKDMFLPSLKHLIELEESGQLPIAHSRAELEFWAKASRSYPHNESVVKRLHKEAEALNNRPLLLNETPLPAELFQNSFDPQDVFIGRYSKRPIPLRALIDRFGKVFHVEPCRQLPVVIDGKPVGISRWQPTTTTAMRIYDPEKMPRIPIVHDSNAPAYQWIRLPAPNFTRAGKGKVKISFFDVGIEECSAFDPESLRVFVPPAPPR